MIVNVVTDLVLIRFGSRVDVYMPPEIKTEVKVGDRVRLVKRSLEV